MEEVSIIDVGAIMLFYVVTAIMIFGVAYLIDYIFHRISEKRKRKKSRENTDRFLQEVEFVHDVIDDRLLYESQKVMYYTSATGKTLERAYIGDTGLDLRTVQPETLPAGERRTFDTGVRLILPRYYEAQVRPKSGLTKEGVDVKFGTIDNGYRGTVMVTMKNDTEFDYVFEKGSKIAQLVTVRRDDIRTEILTAEEYEKKAEEVDNPIAIKGDSLLRKEQGFGSSGR